MTVCAFWKLHGVLPRTNPLWSLSLVRRLMAVIYGFRTTAFTGSATMYRDLFRQVGLVQAPTFELCLNITHALLEMPRLQPTIGIATMGGSGA